MSEDSERGVQSEGNTVPPGERTTSGQTGHSTRLPALVILTAVGIVWLGAGIGSVYLYQPLSVAEIPREESASPPEEVDPEIREQARRLQSEAKRLQSRLRSLRPRGIYVVVETSRNRLYVKRADEVLLEAVCSTGSGLLLRDPGTDRQWIFDTPRGLFHVRRKTRDPVWTKPDWAFVEEGRPVPERWSERLDEETLGDYALYFGDGYMIHGTLYQRYLGRSITHGCVRLGDDDLKRVYELTPLGAAIYIF